MAEESEKELEVDTHGTKWTDLITPGGADYTIRFGSNQYDKAVCDPIGLLGLYQSSAKEVTRNALRQFIRKFGPVTRQRNFLGRLGVVRFTEMDKSIVTFVSVSGEFSLKAMFGEMNHYRPTNSHYETYDRLCVDADLLPQITQYLDSRCHLKSDLATHSEFARQVMEFWTPTHRITEAFMFGHPSQVRIEKPNIYKPELTFRLKTMRESGQDLIFWTSFPDMIQYQQESSYSYCFSDED